MLKTVNGITYCSSPNLEAIPGITHAFLGRTGGVSSGHLSSLNMGRREEDTPEDLKENKRRIVDAFGIDADRIFIVSQIHSDRVVVIDDPTITPEEVKVWEADAIITSMKGIAIGVLTADCVPVLLFDARKGVAAAVHAGWRGTALNIVRKAVEEMTEKDGSMPQDIVATIGPSIGPCCYEVGEDVIAAVGYKDKVAEKHKGDGKWHIDLTKANLLQLREIGVTNIDVSDVCTSCRTDLFFSHRREDGRTGRQLSFISLTSLKQSR